MPPPPVAPPGWLSPEVWRHIHDLAFDTRGLVQPHHFEDQLAREVLQVGAGGRSSGSGRGRDNLQYAQ